MEPIKVSWNLEDDSILQKFIAFKLLDTQAASKGAAET